MEHTAATPEGLLSTDISCSKGEAFTISFDLPSQLQSGDTVQFILKRHRYSDTAISTLSPTNVNLTEGTGEFAITSTMTNMGPGEYHYTITHTSGTVTLVVIAGRLLIR